MRKRERTGTITPIVPIMVSAPMSKIATVDGPMVAGPGCEGL